MSSFNSEALHLRALPEPIPYAGSVSSNRDAYASPPISPYDRNSQKENMECSGEGDVRDPQLFVHASPIAADEPLFPRADSVDRDAQNVISQHMNSEEYFALKAKPEREEYELTVSFVSNVFQSYQKNPLAWFNQERRYDQQYGKPSGVQKRPALKKLAPAPSSGQRIKKVAVPRVPRVPRAPKRTPQTRVYDSFDTVQMPASVSPRPPRPAANRDDTDYNALPDYSPPLDTLPKGNSKILKAEWKGQMLDLSNDVDRHLLHEAELNLASTLRLSCATYLCSKRRIFQARIEALRKKKEFRKTDAQQACKIDDNKASKLWQAYEKVGWFKPEYFREYV